jgi:hypothetical protein
MGLHVGKPGDRICHPKLRQTESSSVVVLHDWSSIGCMQCWATILINVSFKAIQIHNF